MDDGLRDLIEDYLRNRGRRVRYCQRCEEPRAPEEFPPMLGVCGHCLHSMRPGELRQLLPNGMPKQGDLP